MKKHSKKTTVDKKVYLEVPIKDSNNKQTDNLSVTSRFDLAIEMLEEEEKHGHGHSHHGTDEDGNAVAPVAWIVLFGDALHGFLDGITISVAFSDSYVKGFSLTLALVCEEFPHKLGFY
jgi:zinc transporter ZupT